MAEFVTVTSANELAAGEAMALEVYGQGLALYNVDGEFYATANACPHVGGSLGRGRLSGRTVTCPLHGSEFAVDSGACLRPPANEPVQTYDVRVVGSDVQVALDVPPQA